MSLVGKVGPFQLFRWRLTAKFGCLAVFSLCGILAACQIAFFIDDYLWEQPSLETRKQVEENLRSCTLNESDLPIGWSESWSTSLPLFGPKYSLPKGVLGGIFTELSPRISRIQARVS